MHNLIASYTYVFVEQSALDELLNSYLVHEILAAPQHFFLNYLLRLWFFFVRYILYYFE